MPCWHCEKEVTGEALCPHCAMPQPVRQVSHFARLGLPEGFAVDMAALEQAYLQGQRRLHPDRFVRAPAEAKRYAMQQSVALNDAYHVLKSPLKRAEYLLAEQGMRVNTDKPDIKPDACLLMEMLELREYAAEAEDGKRGELATEVADKYKACISVIEQHFLQNHLREAAQETIRLAYLEKLRQELR